MGAQTLQSMRDDVRFVAGGYDSTVLSDTVVDRWLRWAQLHVSRPNVYEHRELFTSGTATLATSTRTYAFTTFGTTTDNVQAVALVVNETRGNRLRPLSLRQLEEASRSGSTLIAGRPTHYSLVGNTMYVYPTPNAAHNGDSVRVWFWRKPTALAASPASELAEEWDEVIVAGATWRAFRYLNLQDRAEVAKAEFGQLINEVGDRLRADMQHDAADRRFDVEVHDYQQESF
jgi:hypothetical protein